MYCGIFLLATGLAVQFKVASAVSAQCLDDKTWKFRNKDKKTCVWVAFSPLTRCSKKSLEGVVASDACRLACDTCRPHYFQGPTNVRYEACSADEQKRLEFAVRYMRAASITTSFEHCLREAVSRGNDLSTSHEASRVGPYVPCRKTGLMYPDPVLPSTNMGYDVVMNVVRANPKRRTIWNKCLGTDNGYTATSPRYWVNSYKTRFECRWGWTDVINTGEIGAFRSRLHIIEWSSKFSSRYPTHAPDEYIDPLFGNLGASYPVDELAGIILHEMIHNVNFGHAAEYPLCYDYWNCPSGPPKGGEYTCRMNSLNEIAEGCMSEVVQLSTDNCDPDMCIGSDEVPIYNEIKPHIDYDDDDRDQWKREGECRCTRFW